VKEMSKIAKWFSKGRRVDAVKILEPHLNLTLNAVKELNEGIKAKLEEKYEDSIKHLKRAGELEEEADVKRRKELKELAKGVLPPLSREDLLNLTDSLDKIADSAKMTAKLTLLVSFINLPKEIKDGLIKLSSLAVKCSEKLVEAILWMNKDFNTTLSLINEVEEIEEDSDEEYDSIRRFLYNSELGSTQLVFINELARGLETIADWCEDTGDLATIIIVTASEA
jgi:predicted phosphate transport protein (TIGR00153 family)